jgi:V/A-type H+-transporting ATPase subunit B
MSAKEYRTASSAKGGLLTVANVLDIAFGDRVQIRDQQGNARNGQVIRGSQDEVLIQVFEGTDDITHPIPDLTGYITEGQIVLSRELHNQGIYPPVHISPSLSRLMKDGIGKDFTREDHPHVSNQLYALYARALETRNLASIIGADELSARDRRYLEFADAFESRFVQQGEDEDRSIEETLNLAWDLLSTFPPQALTRVNETEIAKYHRQST